MPEMSKKHKNRVVWSEEERDLIGLFLSLKLSQVEKAIDSLLTAYERTKVDGFYNNLKYYDNAAAFLRKCLSDIGRQNVLEDGE